MKSIRMLLAAATCFALAGAALLAAGPAVEAAAPAGAFDASASASGIRIAIVKPAALPTSDELAAVSIPYSQAESSSSPLGRAIGSWLWPGETVADAKSLLLVGADPGADEAACAERVAGTSQPKTLVIVPAPGDDIVVADPTDNPCGAAGVKQILTGTIDDDPESATYGQRTGGVVRAMPNYPFWARAQYPANDGADTRDRTVLCGAPGALPEEPWHTPRSACPPGETTETGVSVAESGPDEQHARAVTGALNFGAVRAGSLSSASMITQIGRVLVAQSTVIVSDLALYAPGGAAPVLRIDAVRSSVVAASDGRATAASFTVEGATLTLPGVPATMACSHARPCAVTIDENGVRITDADMPAAAAAVYRDALRAIRIRVQDTPLDAGDASVVAGGQAGGPGTAIAPDRRSAHAAGLVFELAGTNSVEGRTITRLVVGEARASAALRSDPSMPEQPGPNENPDASPPQAGPVSGVPGTVAADPGTGNDGDSTGRAIPPRMRRIASGGLPASRPIPAGIALLALAATLAGTAALIAFGVWQTEPETGP